MDYTICQICDGRGYVESGQCPVCKGKGELRWKEKDTFKIDDKVICDLEVANFKVGDCLIVENVSHNLLKFAENDDWLPSKYFRNFY